MTRKTWRITKLTVVTALLGTGIHYGASRAWIEEEEGSP